MAITIVGVSRARTASIGFPLMSMLIPPPTGLANGDFLYLTVTTNGSVPTTLTGWTLMSNTSASAGGAGTLRHYTYYKFASNEPQNYSQKFPSATLTACSMFVLRGVDPLNPIRTNGLSNTSSTPALTLTPATLSGVFPTDLIIMSGASMESTSSGGSAKLIMPPTGWTTVGTAEAGGATASQAPICSSNYAVDNVTAAAITTATTSGITNISIAIAAADVVPKQLSSYMNTGLLSTKFASAVRETHQITSKAELWYNNGYLTDVPIVSGSVQVDRTADNCRSGTLILGDPTFFPTFVTSPLAPFGVEMHLFSGLVYASGTEWIPLGVFPVEDVTAEESTGGLPTVDFFDRSKRIQRAQFYYPHDCSGQDVRSLITHFVQDVCGTSVKVKFDPYITQNGNVPGGTIFTEDRWAALQTCCGYLNAEGHFGWDGNFYVMPIPTLIGVGSSTPSVFTFDAGDGGVLVSAQRGVSRTGVYNFVSVTGSSNGANVTPVGYAWDSDPRSPTYWGPTQTSGEMTPTPFGSNVNNLSNDLLTTNAQCQAYAVSQLGQQLGLARSLDFTAIPNPALDAGDVVTVVYKDGATETHILDAFQIPLSVSDQTMEGSNSPQISKRKLQAMAISGTQADASVIKSGAKGSVNSGTFIGSTRTTSYQISAGT